MRIKSVIVIVLLLFSMPIALAAGDFKISSLLIKVNAKQGEIVERPIKISSESEQEFNLQISGIEGASIEGDSFFVEAGDTKEISVFFNTSVLEPGVYVGNIRATGSDDIVLLPVVLEVESKDLFFDVNLDIPPQYSEISPGESLVAQLRILDLTGLGAENALRPTEVNVEYLILSFDGEVFGFEKETAVVDRQTQLSKTISFPEDFEEGDYFFVSLVRYKSSTGTSTGIFTVKQEGETAQTGFELNYLTFSVFAFVLAFFIVIIFFFVFLIRDRDKMFLELRKYHALEMRRQKQLLTAQAQIVNRKKPRKKIELDREIEKKVSDLKVKQKKETEEFRKMRRDKRFDKMREKLKSWRNQGYDSSNLKFRLKGLSDSEMRKLLRKWKSEGFKE